MFARFLTVAFYTVLGVVALGFIFSNRDEVALRFPFMATMVAPLYVVLSLAFGLGLWIGLSYAGLRSLAASRRERRQRRTIASLEKELSARELTKSGV